MSNIRELLEPVFGTATKIEQPDIDLCSACGEHSEFDEHGCVMCGGAPVPTDVDEGEW